MSFIIFPLLSFIELIIEVDPEPSAPSKSVGLSGEGDDITPTHFQKDLLMQEASSCRERARQEVENIQHHLSLSTCLTLNERQGI